MMRDGATALAHGQSETIIEVKLPGRSYPIVIGEDLEELLVLCDRIAVMYEGRIVGTLDSADATVARLGLLMTGAEGHS